MKLHFLCTSWGNEPPIEEFVLKVREAGYDGVEMSMPLDDYEQKRRIHAAIAGAGLLFVSHHSDTVTADFETHKVQFLSRLHNLTEGQPLLINSQTGNDFFSFEQNMELVELASAFTRETGLRVVQETHRGKFSFAANVTASFLLRNANLRIGADFSHWCNVAETLLHNQEEFLSLAISRVDHIHARVGFAEGPQVPDPRAPVWKKVLDRHISWWDRIVELSRAESKAFLCITPECGPYPYMTILPGSHQPIANQWDINLFMMNLLRERYSNNMTDTP